MKKIDIRMLKSHYLDRWAVMRHNQRRDDKILFLEDAWLLKKLLPGRTLMLDCIGEIFSGIKNNIDTYPIGLYHNVLMINNISFKYLDPESIYNILKISGRKYLHPDGQLICTLSHRYLIYDRINDPIETIFNKWRGRLDLDLIDMNNMLGRARLAFGDIWLTFRHGH